MTVLISFKTGRASAPELITRWLVHALWNSTPIRNTEQPVYEDWFFF